MVVAAIYDIHGNLPALEAVLAEIRRADVDLVVIGGDVIPGPMQGEALRCLADLDTPARFIRGNGEREVLAQAVGEDPVSVPEQFRDIVRWAAQQLHPEQQRWLAGWPAAVRVEIPELGEVLFCHATPRNDTDVFTRLTPEEPLLPLFEGLDVGVVVCGHTHMQFDRTLGEVRVVNAGSVGMPFGEPGAYWLLLGPDVELRRTSYDLEKAAERIRGSGYPHAEDFAATNVLQPPTEARMLEAFAGVELT